MKEVREKAFLLRKKGRSYNEINRLLGVPKSTLSDWFSGMVLSEEAQKRIQSRVHRGLLNGLIKRNKMQTHMARQRAAKTQKEASAEIGKLTKRELLLIGTALYWGEGYKKLVVRNGIERTWHTVSFVNSDENMIRIFIEFANKVLGIPNKDIKATMRLYNHINEKDALRYWMRTSGLPKGVFRKATYLASVASKRKRSYNRLQYGTLQIEIAQTDKFHRIMGWIEGMKKQI
ncbi:MAG: hypothetical protein ACE5F2_01335 [Candidatus Paceibacteria bacterium]